MNVKHRWMLTLVAVLGMAACATPPAAEQEPAQLALEPCQSEELEGLLCGTLAVYEDREARTGRMIDLYIVVAPALGEDPAPDPVFFLAGGPGDAAATGVSGNIKYLRSLRERRDLVFVDQRGTGASHPLQCDVPGNPDDPQGYFENFLRIAELRTCREQLEQIANLTLYTTSIAMDDIDEVRAALGYEQINLYSVSYGTRAAQVYMRRHPQRVRTATLHGIVSMNQHSPLYHAREAQRGMDLLLAACAEDEACATAFPNVAEELRAVIERLDAEPARVTFPHPETGDEVTVTMRRSIFAESLRFLTYAPAHAVLVPALIHQAYEGDYAVLAQLIVFLRNWVREIIDVGLYMSVVCAEDEPFITPEAAEELTAGTHLGDYRIREMREACAVWPRAEVPKDFLEPVRSETPTLLISGHLDPVTPPSWIDEIAPYLPRSLRAIAPHGHHEFLGLSNPECEENLVRDFVELGSVEGLDPSCFDTMKRGDFVTDQTQAKELLQAILRDS